MPEPFSFSGTSFSTLNTSSGVENLPPGVGKPSPCVLSQAYNARYTKDGGIRNRQGFTEMIDLGTLEKVDDCVTLPVYSATFWKNGTYIWIASRTQLENGVSYTSGLTRTASEKDFLFVNEKDVYAINETDGLVRIAVSQVSVVILDTDVTITVRDIDQFTSGGGTVYVNGDAISYTGVSGNTLTGVTGIQTGGHAVNSIIVQTTAISGAPKGYCMGEFEGSALIGKGTTLSVSLPSTDQEPELFYNFDLTAGATAKRLSSDIRCIKTGFHVALVGMISGLDVVTGFEPNSGAIISQSLTRVHGVSGNRSITQMDKEFAILTNEGRILIAVDGQNGFEIIDDPQNPRNNFDYPIQGYIQKNKDQTDNTQNFIFFNPVTKTLKATILMKDGLTQDIICQRDIGAWSIDDSKNFRCRTMIAGMEFGGDDTADRIHRDEYGTTDNGAPIITRLTTGRLRLGRKGVTGDYLNLVYGGVISENGAFKQRIIHNDAIEEEEIMAEDMVQDGQMSLSSGVSLAEGDLGAETIGGDGDGTEVFTFNYPYEMMVDAEYVQLEWEVSDEGTQFELRYFELSGEHEGELLLNPA